MTGQDLKNSILQLAIQGKLVEQREEDGTAEDLYKQIQEDMRKQIKEGKVKRPKKLPVINEDEIPFDIPQNWKWVRLGELLYKLTDGTHSTPKYTATGVPFISVKDISSGKMDFSNTKFISQEEHESLYKRCDPERDDILLTKVGTTGIPVIVDTDKEFSLFVSVALLKFNTELIYNKYFMYVIKAPVVQIQARENTRGVGNKNWVMRDIANTILPLPPLEEQKRIVAKIEELMPYVDKYDGAYSEVEELNKKFPEDMQKSILQYAIQGKLVEQREEEGTAEELYKHIQEEKKKLIKEGKIKKTKALPTITEDEIPFDIPESWKWVRIENIVDYDLGGGTPSKQNPSYWNGNIPWMTVKDYVNNPNGVEDTLEKITEEGLNKSSSNLIPAGNIIVCTRVGLGKIAVNNVDVAINQDLRALFLSNYIDKKYFIYYFNRLSIVGKGTTVKGIKREELLNYVFPLPPLAEQKRIVEKIEELLPYTNQLVKK